MNIYKLARDYDDPRFSSLEFDVSLSLVGLDSLDKDFDGRNPKLLDWGPISLAHLWEPYVALGLVQPYNDYSHQRWKPWGCGGCRSRLSAISSKSSPSLGGSNS